MNDYDENIITSMFIIESLRSGIPTRLSTRYLPDLRLNLTESIKNDLENFDANNIPLGRIIWGQYGQGKTHVLTTAEHIALDLGFAVSRVSLSREVSCHNLFKFYGKVAPRIKTPDSTSIGIQKALNKKGRVDLPESPILNTDRYIHPLPAIIFEDYYCTVGEEQDNLYGDLMGIRVPMAEFRRIHNSNHPEFPLPKFDTFKETVHAKAYFGLMADIIKFCGYKGWVLLIDEVELMGRLGRASRLKAYLNLNWLLNWNSEMKYPIYVLSAAASGLQDDLFFGKKINDRDIMPELADIKFGSKEKKEIKNFFDKAVGECSLTVSPAKNEDLILLLNKVVEFHGNAYQWQPNIDSNELIVQLENQTARTHIRGMLEKLDIQYLYNEDIKLNAENLIENPLGEDREYFSDEEKEE